MIRRMALGCVLLACTWAQNKSGVDGSGNLPTQPVGINDLLSVTVYGAPELSRAVRVSPDGAMRLPMLKQSIAARGLLPSELEGRIAAAFAEEQILIDPVVTITLAEISSRPIQVAGAVRRPTTFQATGRTTLLDAITRAEGLSADAGQEILVTRTPPGSSSAFTQRISVRDLLENADPQANLLLEGGEEIRVPEVGRVIVVGNVIRPGALPLKGADGMTVMKALAISEGLSRFASKQAYIYRPADGSKTELVVELRKIMDRKAPDIELLAGDIFYIPDNRKGRMTSNVIDKIVSFGAGTASGALVLSVNR
jgi:polysaccharide biosynthesis/export protein